MCCARTISADTVGGAEPEGAVPVLNNRPYVVMSQAVPCGERGPAFGPCYARIIPTEAVGGAEPEDAFLILNDRRHQVACQAVSCGEGGPGDPVIPAHPAALDADPEKTGPVLDNRPHHAAGKAVGRIVGSPVLLGGLCDPAGIGKHRQDQKCCDEPLDHWKYECHSQSLLRTFNGQRCLNHWWLCHFF